MICQDLDTFTNTIQKVTEILKQIPFSAWESIVENEPEWKEMVFFQNKLQYGQFAVIMIILGLNDYQLKKKADFYWNDLRKLLEKPLLSQPISIPDLILILTDFYNFERLGSNKVRRLQKFMESRLAQKLWFSQPEGVANKFPIIWKMLAETMQQQPQDKTIAFAMKCLGITLMMAGYYDFDYSKVPIPVDLRIKYFTNKVGFLYESDEEIRTFWEKVLLNLRSNENCITMIHLDSLIWQIGTASRDDINQYFNNLYLPKIGQSLSSLIID